MTSTKLPCLLVALASCLPACSARPPLPRAPSVAGALVASPSAFALSVEAPSIELVSAADDLPSPSPSVPAVEGPRSRALACGLMSPMPGGFTAGYAADTGLDLAGIRLAVFAVAAGEVEYAEAGHSLWTGPRDTDLAVRVKLDAPILHDGRRITHVWYAHLSALAFEQAEGATPRRHVEAGEWLGTSGVANGAWHLHLGLLLDDDTSQRWGTFLLEDAVRSALCGLRARQRLPPLDAPRAAGAGVRGRARERTRAPWNE